jgi:hypothetical protein
MSCQKSLLRQDEGVDWGPCLIRDSIDEIASRCRRAAKRPVEGRDAGLGKIDNFLTGRLGQSIVFQKSRQAQLTLLLGDARLGFDSQGQETDSEMAPQSIEIAQNGLGNGGPAARGRWEGEWISRISYQPAFWCFVSRMLNTARKLIAPATAM